MLLYSFTGKRTFSENVNLYQNWPIPGHFLLNSPVPMSLPSTGKPIRRPFPLNPTSSQATLPRTKKDLIGTSSSDSSSEPFEYTRDKLLGAVEKVRSGYLLSRSSPVRHTIEGK